MPYTKEGVWYPSISKRQAELLAESSHTYIDVEGPRRSAKSVACCHRLARHLWECPDARAAMAGRTLTDNFDGGTWQMMVEHILPEWIESGIGMEWHYRPRMSNLTHKMELAVTNRHGGISRLQLDSLKNEKEVERVFKGRQYSAIYMTEASNFKRRQTFEIMRECLRSFGDKWKPHLLFILDTNPAEEGQSHWIYQLFHVFKNMTDKEMMERYPNAFKQMIDLRNNLAVYRFSIDDNIWINERERSELEANFMLAGPDAYARHWLGEWRSSPSDSAFAVVWRPETHIVGDEPTLADPDPVVLLPEDDCTRLYSGWDLGDIHNAIVIVEKVYAGNNGEEVSVFKVLDELVYLSTPMRLEDLTHEFMEKMQEWEEHLGHRVQWTHWADSSALSGYDNITGSSEAQEVYRASGGRVQLNGARKGPNSVMRRLQLVRRLLHSNRLFISSRCENLIASMNNLKLDSSGSLRKSGDIYRHVFDALSYLLIMENMMDFSDGDYLPKTGKSNILHT